MKKIHMTRAELDAEAIDLVTEDVQTQAFDGEILPGLLSLIPIEKLIELLPADEEDEEEAARYVLVERQFAAHQHWEKVFADGYLADEQTDFLMGVFAKAREELKPQRNPLFREEDE